MFTASKGQQEERRYAGIAGTKERSGLQAAAPRCFFGWRRFMLLGLAAFSFGLAALGILLFYVVVFLERIFAGWAERAPS